MTSACRAAGVTIFAKNTGRVLLIRRSSLVTRPGLWTVPAGRLDPGETPLQAALRETEEETGYNGPLTVMQVYRDLTFANFVAWAPREFTPKLNWESDMFGWFDNSQDPHPLHPGMGRLLNTCLRPMVD